MTKVAIIDPLGGHGSSHHFYLYGQADGLVENKISVSLYTNNKTNFKLIDKKFFDYAKSFNPNKVKTCREKYVIVNQLDIFESIYKKI